MSAFWMLRLYMGTIRSNCDGYWNYYVIPGIGRLWADMPASRIEKRHLQPLQHSDEANLPWSFSDVL